MQQLTTHVHPILDVLKNRLFRRLWIGQMTSQLSSNMLIFLLAILVYRITKSNAAVSGLFLSYGLPSLLFGPMGGVIVDRLDRRAVLLASHCIRALLIIPVFLFPQYLAVTYGLVFLYAIIMQLTTPSEIPLIPQFVPKTQIVAANSLFSFTLYSSMAIGFIFAGPALRVLGGFGTHIFLFVCFAVAALSVSGIPPQGEGLRSLRHIFHYNISYIFRRLFEDLQEGFRYVMQTHALRDAVLLLTGTQIMLVLLGTLGPGFADKVLQIDVRDASLLIVGPTIVGILFGALWVGNRGYMYSAGRLINIGVVSAGSLLMVISALFAATNTLWFTLVPRPTILTIALAIFFLLGVANSLLDVPSNSTIQKESRGAVRGRVYGILSASVGGVGMLPVIISGILADVIGVGMVIFILGGAILCYGLYRVKFKIVV